MECALNDIVTNQLDYYLPTRIVFGWGKAAEIAELARPLGRRALLVTMKDIPHGQRVAELLKAGGFDVVVFDDAEPDPSIEGIDAAAHIVREGGFDFVVGVGGGSALDTAKAFAMLAGGEGSAWEYTVEMGDAKRTCGPGTLPVIAVPTTAGTGSEVTCRSVLTNKGLRVKAPVYDQTLYPRVSIVDPELTVTMPKRLTASTGFDAFTHAYERFFGADLCALVHVLSLSGMKMVLDNLEDAVKDPQARRARAAMSWAATHCALGLASQGGESGLHIFGLPLGAVAGVSHGESLAVVMRVITRESFRRLPERGRELAGLFGVATEGRSDQDVLEDLLEAADAWLGRLGLGRRLCDHGIGADKIEALTAAVSRERVRTVFGDGFGEDGIRRVYEESLSY